MKPSYILSINAGSSSIKFSLFSIQDSLKEEASGNLEKIGMNGTHLRFHYYGQASEKKMELGKQSYLEAGEYLVQFLIENMDFSHIIAIGHRLVQGFHFVEPERIDTQFINDLKELIPLDPDHLPLELGLMEVFQKKFPKLIQMACFDTSFHNKMPKMAKFLNIPRKYFEKGIYRYGFHGISYSYILFELEKLIGYKAKNSKIIIAHLGSGASMVAIRDGQCQDTSMGFTPNSGFIMGTRSGDLEPGIFTYLQSHEGMSLNQLNTLLNKESGLLGISETSSDMRELKEIRHTDIRAEEAINLLSYQVRKWIGSLVSVLEGLDILIFTGGIGENDPDCRLSIGQGMKYLGLELDRVKNSQNAPLISLPTSAISVRVIPTREEWMMASLICQKMNILVKV